MNKTSPGLWRQFFDTPSYHKFFETAEETTWKYVLPTTVRGVVARALSKSYIAVLPDDERKKVEDSLRTILETEQKTHALEALGPIAKEPRARERFEVEVRDQEAALERARDDEANARARVEANTVDAEQVAGYAERVAGWSAELAALQRRERVYVATLEAIGRN